MDIELIKNIVDYGIIGVLGFMSFLTLWFWIERLLFFRSLELSKFTCKKELEISLTNNTTILSTFGSNAPYIGLLGTVVAIIITFYILGLNGNIDVKNIMTSLALALKATAMGLLVAIPAIFFYNHIARKIEVILTQWDIMHDNQKFDSINVVPFIDIMLVLLVIVLTTASFVAKGLIPLDLSASKNATNFQINKELIISLDAKNRVFLNNEVVSKEEFENKLLSFSKSTPIIINADKKIAFEEFIFLLDILKKHQYKNLGIITENE